MIHIDVMCAKTQNIIDIHICSAEYCLDEGFISHSISIKSFNANNLPNQIPTEVPLNESHLKENEYDIDGCIIRYC